MGFLNLSAFFSFQSHLPLAPPRAQRMTRRGPSHTRHGLWASRSFVAHAGDYLKGSSAVNHVVTLLLPPFHSPLGFLWSFFIHVAAHSADSAFIKIPEHRQAAWCKHVLLRDALAGAGVSARPCTGGYSPPWCTLRPLFMSPLLPAIPLTSVTNTLVHHSRHPARAPVHEQSRNEEASV